MAASVLGALGAPVFLASAAAAAQPPGAEPPAPPAAADVKLAYAAPRVAADGDHLVWRWTLTNEGAGSAGGVVLVHRLTPALKISRLAKECRAIASGVSCSYGTIKAGQRKAGSLEAELSRDVSGTVEINGRVTWQQGTAGSAGSNTDVAPAKPPSSGTPAGPGGAAPTQPKAPAQPGQAPAKPGQVPAQPGQAPAKPGQVPAKPGQAPAQPGQAPVQLGHAPVKPGQVPIYPGHAQGQTVQGAHAAAPVKRPGRMPH
jgi:phage baseplate assembly protein gpV